MSEQKKRLPRMEDYQNIHYFGLPSFHGELKTIVFTDTYMLPEKPIHENMWTTAIRSFCLSAPHQIRTVINSASEKKRPSLLRDGSLFFLSEEDGMFSLFCYRDSSEKKIVSLEYGISDYSLSPDEEWIFLMGWDAPYSKEFTEPVVYESHPFKSDADLGFKVLRNQTLWLYHRASKRLTCLLDGSCPFQNPLWRPDSSGILYQVPDKNSLAFYEILPKESSIRFLFKTAGVSSCLDNKSGMKFTSEGTSLIFAANRPGDEFADPSGLYLVPLNKEGSEEISAVPLIHGDYNPCGVSISAYPFLYKDEKIETFDVTPDNRLVYLSAKEGSVHLFEVPVQKDGNAVPKEITNNSTCCHTVCCLTGDLVLSLFSGPVSLPELTLLSLTDGSAAKITKENDWTKELLLTEAEIHWNGTPGTADYTQGFFIPPANLSPEKTYPAILCCHGGPTGFYSSTLELEYQALAAAGFAVIYANPRGSTGYGTIHSADEDAYNGNASSDLENFVLKMCELHPYIDKNRLGVCGGSYGGYLTAYFASHNHIFAAASCQRPLLNWQMIGYASHSAGCMHTRAAFPDFSDYIKECLDISPTTCACDIHIPFQIQQGLRDANCIAEQVFQLYTAIRNFNPQIPCRMILYPGAGHSLLSKSPASLAAKYRNDNLDWFLTHL